jgi:hypothetical protein
VNRKLRSMLDDADAIAEPLSKLAGKGPMGVLIGLLLACHMTKCHAREREDREACRADLHALLDDVLDHVFDQAPAERKPS